MKLEYENQKKEDEVTFVKRIQVKDIKSSNLPADGVDINTSTHDEMATKSNFGEAIQKLEGRVTQQERSMIKLKELVLENMRK